MKTSIKLFHWLPRIICILAIMFISLFATDAFGPGLTIWQQLGAFIMHMIPSFVLIAILIVAWKWELIGGIIFASIGLVASPFIFMLNHGRNHFTIGASIGVVMAITFPFIVIGVLFIISHNLKKKNLSMA
jgi:hypothetical protein